MGLLIGLTLASAALLVVLRLAARSPSLTAGMRVVGRLTLEPRRSIYLVEVGGRCLVVGVGEGPMALLSELPELPAAGTTNVAPSEALARPERCWPAVDDCRRAWRRVIHGGSGDGA